MGVTITKFNDLEGMTMDAETRERFRRIGLSYPGEEQEEVDPESEMWFGPLMMDFKVLRPSAFCKITDIPPSDDVVSD